MDPGCYKHHTVPPVSRSSASRSQWVQWSSESVPLWCKNCIGRHEHGVRQHLMRYASKTSFLKCSWPSVIQTMNGRAAWHKPGLRINIITTTTITQHLVRWVSGFNCLLALQMSTTPHESLNIETRSTCSISSWLWVMVHQCLRRWCLLALSPSPPDAPMPESAWCNDCNWDVWCALLIFLVRE